MKFTWNPAKREKVFVEHKVDFDKITDVFDDPLALEFVDIEHSSEEEVRFAIIGLTAQYGLIYAVHTAPSDDEIHFVTARRAEPLMVKEYDKERGRS